MFGHENGLASSSEGQSSGGVLARARAQIARRAEEEVASGGAAATRANAIEESVGEYIRFLLLL